MKRILLVEDDARLSALIREHLEGLGYAVTVASDGEAGLTSLSAKPDLILLDVMLSKDRWIGTPEEHTVFANKVNGDPAYRSSFIRVT